MSLEGRVKIITGDITKQEVDAIVNAANISLLGGGGVDGAIHRAGGPMILAQCRELRSKEYAEGLPTGEAVMTMGGDLPARYVIHTVGPVWGEEGGRETQLLAACYRNSLSLAAQNGFNSIAFPAISTGAYGFPPEKAAAVASRAIAQFLSKNDLPKEVRLVFRTQASADVFLKHQQFER